MTNRRVSSRSRSLSRPSARHATRGTASSSSWQGGAPIEKAKLQYALARARERSHSPIKGKGKCKDKGKGKGQPKGQRKDWHMNAFKKNSGFKKVNFELVDWIFDIDIFKHSLWLVPLAVRQMTNPVYAHKPAQGNKHKQILRDLSHSPDCDGIMAIGALKIGTLGTKEFICANVILSTGEEGWINVCMRDLSNLQSRQWTIYLKVCAVERATGSDRLEVVEPTKKMSYWAFEFLPFLDMILSFCDPNPTDKDRKRAAQYNQIACCNRASNIAWRRLHTPEVRGAFTWLIKFLKRATNTPAIRAHVLNWVAGWVLDTADMIGLHPAQEIWDQA